MEREIQIEFLEHQPEAVAVLEGWFEAAWPSYYGPTGPGNARADLLACSEPGGLPIGVIAFVDGTLCGTAALKPESITTHSHLAPWIAAGYVIPEYRKMGIGAKLIGALEEIAKTLGYTRIYCGTNTANRLLERCAWEVLEEVEYNGERLSIYRKTLET